MDPLDLAITRKHQIVEIRTSLGVRRYRVREPPPRRGLRVTGKMAKILGPMLTQILGGKVTLMKRAQCPRCGEKDSAESINGDRWLCKAAKDDQPCNHVWDQAPLCDADGKPRRLTLGLALSSEAWRSRLAGAVEERLGALDDDGDALVELVDDMLVSNLDAEQPFGCPPGAGTWLQLSEPEHIDQFVPTPRALLQLARAALECWVLPMLGGDHSGTPPASTESETGGDSTSEKSTAGRPGRAPPRTARNPG